jgi:hypothetical protein
MFQVHLHNLAVEVVVGREAGREVRVLPAERRAVIIELTGQIPVALIVIKMALIDLIIPQIITETG